MIRLHTPLSAHFADIAEVIHIFYPEEQVLPAPAEDCDVFHHHEEINGFAQDCFTWADASFRWSAPIIGDVWEAKRRRKRAIKQACYYLLKRKTGISPPWGSLTGIRPTRLFYERLARGDKPAEAKRALLSLFDLREDKAQMLQDVVRAQEGLIRTDPQAVDLYIGIPFCRTRCAYCSFFAEAVGKGRKVPPYLAALLRELEATAALIQEKGLTPRALYVGGGTPTALDATSLEKLLTRAGALFPNLREWTVEAGRPDTIDKDKLAAMREAGVTRIAINPQTMHDPTLAAIGRGHTAEDTRRAYYLAREMGFTNINMDVIAALPGEDAAIFWRTLDAIEAMCPDSITIHTLARKHGSRYNEFGFEPVPGDIAEAMVEMGAFRAKEMGMQPYYLYRQKYVIGNLENVAYALPGKESLYNIDIMEETTSVLAVGAGGISKRVFPGAARIERAPNVGEVGQYIDRVEEMIARKRKLWGAM
ncbi:MAG: coproporphyrinogen dehydrogenase HemZ [Oscillospiraceae bacterium]|jgi:oxygen-independent coproporphyrinogen-3 oxidase|nr:coproporphyrinogen dehydrogenase HemZ [Oscillospiraceae bacterium]